jgi:hypothetical protein
MAKRSQDLAAAKAKKQKIILIVGGVLLLAVAAFQGPKLMKGSGSTAAPEASSASAGSGSAVTPGAVGVVSAPKGSAMVAGVVLPKATVLKVAPSQLASFTLFEVKDPFVPGVGETVAAADTASQDSTVPPPDAATGDATTAGGDASATTGGTPTPAAPPPPFAYATINFDGKPQQVQAKDQFPTAAPLFVVRSVKKHQVKIGVAGGSFDDNQAVTLKQGKKVTLVNTATGVRYVLKLVYTGATPELIQSFTTTTPDSTSTANALAGTAPAATPTTK